MARRLLMVALVGALALVVCTDRARAEGPLLPTPALSEVDKLKIEIFTLKQQLARSIADADACRSELGPVRTRLNEVAIAVEADTLATFLAAQHPGYQVNRTTWTLEVPPAKPSAPGPKP